MSSDFNLITTDYTELHSVTQNIQFPNLTLNTQHLTPTTNFYPFSASAPLTISSSSFVIEAWRALL
jgi:hypothetical protein